MINLCTLAWPCVGIHHGLGNCGGAGMREDGGEKSDVAAATRHTVTEVTRFEFSYIQGYNSANCEPKIMVLRSLKSSQGGLYLCII